MEKTKEEKLKELMQDYLYPILRSVTVDAPITGLDLERAFLAGYDTAALLQFSDKNNSNYYAEILTRIEDIAKGQCESQLNKNDE
jgi:hypothetical protein